jgi:hypothetical protein
MRISDADRARVVDELRRHAGAGRLDLDAYAARVAEAMEAETLADLDHALRDLPTLRIADPAPDPPLLAPGGGRARRRPPASDPGSDPGGGSDAWARVWARFVVLLSVVVVVVGVSLLVLAHWVWAGVLVAGWLVGVLQGRVRLGRRGRT